MEENQLIQSINERINMMKNILVIVDMQYGFMNENTKHLEDKINCFIDKNKDNFELIIATQYINHDESPCYKFEGWMDCMKGTHESEVLDSIKQKADLIVSKDVYSCWNKISDIVKGANKIYYVGVNTGCCVLHSVFDTYNDLQDCSVISDLCGSTSGEDSHNAALQVLRECITKERVITKEQAEEAIEEEYTRRSIKNSIKYRVEDNEINNCIFYISTPKSYFNYDIENNETIKNVINILKRNNLSYEIVDTVPGSWDLNKMWLQTENVKCAIEYSGVFPISWNIDDIIELSRLYHHGDIIINIEVQHGKKWEPNM